MKRSKNNRYKRKKYYGKDTKHLIRSTSLKRKYYGKGIFGPLSLDRVFSKFLDRRWG